VEIIVGIIRSVGKNEMVDEQVVRLNTEATMLVPPESLPQRYSKNMSFLNFCLDKIFLKINLIISYPTEDMGKKTIFPDNFHITIYLQFLAHHRFRAICNYICCRPCSFSSSSSSSLLFSFRHKATPFPSITVGCMFMPRLVKIAFTFFAYSTSSLEFLPSLTPLQYPVILLCIDIKRWIISCYLLNR